MRFSLDSSQSVDVITPAAGFGVRVEKGALNVSADRCATGEPTGDSVTTRALDLDLELARAHVLDQGHARDRASDLTNPTAALHRRRHAASTLGYGLAGALEHALDLVRIFVGSLDRDLARDLGQALDRASALDWRANLHGTSSAREVVVAINHLGSP